MAPAPDRTLKRYLPSPLRVISRLIVPCGRVLRIVLAMGVRAPFGATENAATEDVPELSTYTHLPLGVMAFQQLPSPNVGRLWVIAVRDPSLLMVYVEMLDTSVPLG